MDSIPGCNMLQKAACTTFGQSIIFFTRLRASSYILNNRFGLERKFSIISKSPPAQKAFPRPVSTTTETVGSNAISFHICVAYACARIYELEWAVLSTLGSLYIFSHRTSVCMRVLAALYCSGRLSSTSKIEGKEGFGRDISIVLYFE